MAAAFGFDSMAQAVERNAADTPAEAAALGGEVAPPF